jgi:hypothetical protein
MYPSYLVYGVITCGVIVTMGISLPCSKDEKHLWLPRLPASQPEIIVSAQQIFIFRQSYLVVGKILFVEGQPRKTRKIFHTLYHARAIRRVTALNSGSCSSMYMHICLASFHEIIKSSHSLHWFVFLFYTYFYFQLLRSWDSCWPNARRGSKKINTALYSALKLRAFSSYTAIDDTVTSLCNCDWSVPNHASHSIGWFK